MSKKRSNRSGQSRHEVVKEDINPFGEQRLWCSCGARCSPGIKSTAQETWRQHLEGWSFMKAAALALSAIVLGLFSGNLGLSLITGATIMFTQAFRREL